MAWGLELDPFVLDSSGWFQRLGIREAHCRHRIREHLRRRPVSAPPKSATRFTAPKSWQRSGIWPRRRKPPSPAGMGVRSRPLVNAECVASCNTLGSSLYSACSYSVSPVSHYCFNAASCIGESGWVSFECDECCQSLPRAVKGGSSNGELPYNRHGVPTDYNTGTLTMWWKSVDIRSQSALGS